MYAHAKCSGRAPGLSDQGLECAAAHYSYYYYITYRCVYTYIYICVYIYIYIYIYSLSLSLSAPAESREPLATLVVIVIGTNTINTIIIIIIIIIIMISRCINSITTIITISIMISSISRTICSSAMNTHIHAPRERREPLARQRRAPLCTDSHRCSPASLHALFHSFRQVSTDFHLFSLIYMFAPGFVRPRLASIAPISLLRRSLLRSVDSEVPGKFLADMRIPTPQNPDYALSQTL